VCTTQAIQFEISSELSQPNESHRRTIRKMPCVSGHPVHELIMTAENQLAPVVSGCHKNRLVIDLSNLQAHLPLTPN